MSKGSIVADESVDFRIVSSLREIGFEVFAIVEQSPAITDQDVMQIAIQRKSLLITEDKDFGELVFRLQLPHAGILLIRVLILEDIKKLSLVVNAIETHFAELPNFFSVLTDKGLRIRKG